MRSIKPWFSPENLTTLRSTDQIAVVGSGLSGTAIARALAERNFKVFLMEQDSVAAHASGNAVGLYNVQLSKLPNPISRFSKLALFHFLKELQQLGLPTEKGIMRLDAAREREEFKMALLNSGYPADFYEDREDGIFFPDCGIVNPKKLCELRSQHPNIEMIYGTVKTTEKKSSRKFVLLNEERKILCECDHVIYATGASQKLEHYLEHPHVDSLPTHPIRGQIIYLSPTQESEKIHHSLVDSGYITPIAEEITGMHAHAVGATYQVKKILENQIELDSEQLLQEAKEKHPAFTSLDSTHLISSRVGFRLATPDKLPILGPLCNPDQLKKDYSSALRSGRTEALPPLTPEKGEWLFLGMGSRGITYSSYAAEILASLMCGEPLPIESDLWEHLHSARFIVRNLKKPEAPDPKPR